MFKPSAVEEQFDSDKSDETKDQIFAKLKESIKSKFNLGRKEIAVSETFSDNIKVKTKEQKQIRSFKDVLQKGILEEHKKAVIFKKNSEES